MQERARGWGVARKSPRTGALRPVRASSARIGSAKEGEQMVEGDVAAVRAEQERGG